MGLHVRRRWSDRDPVVLCVDDDPGVLNAMRRSLRDEPCEVITAGSSAEALAWLDELAVDLVITDQQMPGMTGAELLREVWKRSPGTARALLTGHRAPTAVLLELDARSDAYLTKPWDERLLVETVRRLLRRGEVERRREADAGVREEN